MKLSYTVSIREPQTKYFYVTVHLEQVKRDHVELKLPVWIPGSYLVREFAKDLSHVEVKSKTGRRLPFAKIDKTTWSIDTKGQSHIEMSYRVYGGEVGVHGAYLDSRIAFFNPPCLLMYEESLLRAPVDLKLHMPRGWKIATALTVIGKNHYRAADIDELYDSPIQVSPSQDIYHFTVSGKRHQVALFGTTLAAQDQIVRDIKRLVETEIQIFGEAPYDHYTFLIQFFPGLYGGLEHRASSTNIFDGLLMGEKEKYTEFLALLSHEFFHTWNVKRIRPAALGPFDYSKEAYTRELWVAEGVTSYYDDHVLYRAGFFTRDEYFEKVLTKSLARYENFPSKALMSLSESSFDAWIKLYRPSADHPNTVMSYYLKGSLIALLLDLEIIRLTKGRRTFDDVMRGLWKAYRRRPETGFTREEFDLALFSVCPDPELKRFLRDFVDGVKKIDWPRFFKPFGVHLVPKVLKDGEKDRLLAYLGLRVVERNGAIWVDQVLADTPAFLSALQSGDELLAFDGVRVHKEKTFSDILAIQKPGTSHEILFSRQGKIETTSLAIIKNPEFRDEVKAMVKPTASQKRLQKRWLRKR